jgi:hypothetical protein
VEAERTPYDEEGGVLMAQTSKKAGDARDASVLKHSDEGFRWVMAVVPATFIGLVIALIALQP